MVKFSRPYPKEKFPKQNLESAIFRVDFPTQLKMLNLDPIEFQETIKSDFPKYQKLAGNHLEIKMEKSGPQVISNPAPIINRFISSNEKCHIELSANHLAYSISGEDYNGFDRSMAVFCKSLGALDSIYKIPFFTRIGLRKIGRHNEAFADKAVAIQRLKVLFNAPLGATLGISEIGNDIIESIHRTSFKADSHRMINFQYGIQEGFIEEAKKALSFFLDFDCFTEGNTDANKILDLLTGSNDLLWQFYNWAITDEMRKVLRGQ